MLAFKILCGWFALSGIAGFFMYCCSRVSADEPRHEALVAADDDELEPSTEAN